MIGTSPGIVLSRRAFGESDRLASVYTRDLGRITLRFIGVLKSPGKLKALSEPMVRGEFRLHLRTWQDMGRCIGGQLSTVYPALRSDYERTCRGLHLCELTEKLTPERSPNPERFELLAACLASLEAHDSRWTPLAFTFRFLQLSGLRPPDPLWPEEDLKLWRALLGAPLDEVAALPEEPRRLAALRELAERHVQLQLDRPLKSAAFLS